MAKGLGEYPRAVQAAILVVVVLLLASGAVWYWILPLNNACTLLAKQVTDLHAQNAANRALEQQQTLLQKRIAEAKEKLKELQTMVPDEPDTDGLVNLVRQAEAASGVHVRSLAAQTPVPAEEYIELPFKLRVDGGYFGLVNFFDRLGQAARITNVSGMTLGAPVASGHGSYKPGATETVATDFILSAYYNRAPGGPPPGKEKKK